MRLLAACVATVLGALVAGCGGAAGPSPGAATLYCQAAPPIAGALLHAALPATLFPARESAATPQALVPAALAAVLDQQVDDLARQTGAPGLTAAITLPGLGRWSKTGGLAQVAPAQPVNGDSMFYWGSVAKMLTAVLVLQLVEEGRLQLDAPLSRWYAQIPQAQHITIAQLLNHTSGLRTQAMGASGLGLETPAQQVAALATAPLLFCPGTDASYSNAGYLMLGLVVEAVEQRPFHQSVQQRIAQPLGLLHLRALRPGEDMPDALATPHTGRTPQPDPGAWTRLGAGNVVARAEDMAVFWQAVLSGQLLQPSTVQSQWKWLYALGPQATEANQGNSWFGKGVMLIEWTDDAAHARAWLGHLGGIPTANAVVLYDHTADAYAAVAVNSEVASNAVANALLKTVGAWRASR